ncbi:MAG: hypothetical protein GSR84_02090 [Desulfurococcales archaeon]|nr:hypothetical protein [Desulfurococcales archaeon]
MVEISEEPVEGEIELAERKSGGEDESEEVVVTQYKISDPLLVEALLEVTDILEAVARGGLTISEARAIAEERVYSKIRSLIEAKPEVKKKKSSRRRKSS